MIAYMYYVSHTFNPFAQRSIHPTFHPSFFLFLVPKLCDKWSPWALGKPWHFDTFRISENVWLVAKVAHPTNVQEWNKGKVTILCITEKMCSNMTLGQTRCFLTACNMKLFKPLTPPSHPVLVPWMRIICRVQKLWNLIAAPSSTVTTFFLPKYCIDTCASYIQL